MTWFATADRLTAFAGLASALRDSGRIRGNLKRPRRYHRGLNRVHEVTYVDLVVDLYADEPLYARVAAALRARIESGELARLDLLPSEKTIEQEYEVSRDTARRAVKLLRDEGLVFTIPERGTYVGPRP
jgi:GntR family transcriptional regulator